MKDSKYDAAGDMRDLSDSMENSNGEAQDRIDEFDDHKSGRRRNQERINKLKQDKGDGSMVRRRISSKKDQLNKEKNGYQNNGSDYSSNGNWGGDENNDYSS